MKNAWTEHLKEIKKQNPKLSSKERMKLAQETYKKKGEEETKDYITREELNKYLKYDKAFAYLTLGLIFLIPILYSIAANTKNYLGFYGMCAGGLFLVGYSAIKYFKWRKKYKEMKRSG